MNTDVQIIYFDADCLLCNNSVQFLLKRDIKKLFRYAPLNGITAQINIPINLTLEGDSIVLQQNMSFKTQSNAVLSIITQLGGIYKMAYFGYIFPTFIRNFIYQYIANNRYKWFGKNEVCVLVAKEEQYLFLD